MHYRVWHCTVLHYTTLHCSALHYVGSQCTALHFTILHCISLYCTALHCTALHCVVENLVTQNNSQTGRTALKFVAYFLVLSLVSSLSSGKCELCCNTPLHTAQVWIIKYPLHSAHCKQYYTLEVYTRHFTLKHTPKVLHTS